MELIPLFFLLPVASFAVILFLGERLPAKGASVGIAAMGFCFAVSLYLMAGALTDAVPLPYKWTMPWFRFGMYEMTLGVYVDGLSIVMLTVVTLVSLLVQVYSLGYMHGDLRFKRYYAYLSLFTASMLGLVIADNLMLLFACWELVGLCSYLLIGFWFEKPEAAQAGRKAFITTKLGDLGFGIGLLLIFSSAGTLSIPSLQQIIQDGFLPANVALAASLLLFCGAMGKSAQMPLFVWLPDAMEGPTPVSALIHAATMVAAGVFLVARAFFLFEANPAALQVVALIGGLTAFCAALMGTVPEDLKRVLAFSTISQLGYMMAGLAVGGPQVGMFHLTTHACFKALLFLGAGSVIHAVHTNDMWKMGALSAKMPVTFCTFAIGVLALAGIFPFSGFFSKDEIIHSAIASGNVPVAILLLLTAGITAYYMTRALILTFLGACRDQERYAHAHESPASMTAPLIVLAVPAVFLGALSHMTQGFAHLVPAKLEHEVFHVSTLAVAGVSSAMALSGIALAWTVYKARLVDYEKVYQSLKPLWQFLYDRMGFDRAWLFLVNLGSRLANFLAWFDHEILDQGIVDFFGWITTKISNILGWFDRVVVDGLVDLWGYSVDGLGRLVRLSVGGLVQSYLLYAALGAGFMLAARLYF